MEAGLQALQPVAHGRAARRARAANGDTAATAALTVLGQKWVLRIIHALGERTQRFCELQDTLGGANSATLSQRLKLLEDQGLITRRVISSVPPWVEYSLTAKGLELCEAMAPIDRWADRWAVS